MKVYGSLQVSPQGVDGRVGPFDPDKSYDSFPEVVTQFGSVEFRVYINSFGEQSEAEAKVFFAGSGAASPAEALEKVKYLEAAAKVAADLEAVVNTALALAPSDNGFRIAYESQEAWDAFKVEAEKVFEKYGVVYQQEVK